MLLSKLNRASAIFISWWRHSDLIPEGSSQLLPQCVRSYSASSPIHSYPVQPSSTPSFIITVHGPITNGIHYTFIRRSPEYIILNKNTLHQNLTIILFLGCWTVCLWMTLRTLQRYMTPSSSRVEVFRLVSCCVYIAFCFENGRGNGG